MTTLSCKKLLPFWIITCVVITIYMCGDIFPYEEYFEPGEKVTHTIDYRLNIKPPKCEDSVDLLILVLSVAENSEKRDAIRNTWGSVAKTGTWPSSFVKYNAKLVFLFGTYDKDSQKKLELEAKNNEDIIQIDYPESYQLPSDKLLMALKWAEGNCRGVQNVIKTDDDIFANIPVIVEKLQRQSGMFLFGDVILWADVHRVGKHLVTNQEYPFFFYPSYLIGYCYFMSWRVARSLLHAASHAPFLKFEDVYIGGMLPRSTKSELIQMNPSWLGMKKNINECDFIRTNLFAAADLNTTFIREIWNTFRDRRRCS